MLTSWSLTKLQSRCQPELQSSQGTTWKEFASRLTHVNLRGHVGSKGLPHDMSLGFSQSERWIRGNTYTRSHSLNNLIVEVTAHHFCCTGISHCIVFQDLLFLQIERLWQPCNKQVHQCHFPNNICSLCVSGSYFSNSHNISNPPLATRLQLTESSGDG